MIEARLRILDLVFMRNRLRKSQADDGTWSWWIDQEIAEIEAELAKQHYDSWAANEAKTALKNGLLTQTA